MSPAAFCSITSVHDNIAATCCICFYSKINVFRLIEYHFDMQNA
jgi:hypothetical protein